MENFWLPFAVAFAIFLALELALSLRRSRKQDDAQSFLRLAKREALETAQISLGNPYPLIQISGEGDIIFINPAAFEQFPGIREQGLRHPVLAGFHDLIGKGEKTSREIKVGEITYNQTITATKIQNQSAFTIYCYDVTERAAYEKMLQESREIAERANQSRGDFLANMSHELRTPMNGIIGLSDILSKAGLKPEHQELIEAVNTCAHDLLTLLNDILDFSKIEAGELTLESIPFDLRKMVRQIETLQKPYAADKGLEIKSAVDDAVPPYLLGDPSRLQQIINNLLGNALKFTAEGSVTLSVSGEPDGKGYFVTRISVRDTGIGIPQDKQEKLFQKFQQADASTSRKYGGTGLGLAISKNLAELMGGSISLESVEGQGSTFTVTIPALIAEPGVIQEDEGEHETEPVRINKAAKIMVVDDHPINLLFIRKALNRLGFENFVEASSGKQAVELLKQDRYDLILMDCQMPEMDGYEASRQMRQMESEGNRPVIIAITANAMKGEAEKCAAAGMDDYLSKPVDKDKLNLLLQRYLPGGEGEKTEQTEKTAPVFDWNHLYEYTNGDKQTEAMLINLFLETLELDLEALQKSFRHKNFDEWEAMAHKLYGASVNMGANALANICDQAQFLSSAEADKMKDLHALILMESQRLHSALEKPAGSA